MTTRMTRYESFVRNVVILFLLGHVGFAACQPAPAPSGGERSPRLIMVMRQDPTDPEHYIKMFGDDRSGAIRIYRDGRRLSSAVPRTLQRGDEIETRIDVVAVIRYPVGNAYIGGATRVRIGSLDVIFGKVFARVRGLFSVESQNVVAGVEGTEFAFAAARDGSVHVTVLDGVVRCSSRSLSWSAVPVARDQAFAATGSRQAPRVGPASSAELAELRSWVQRVDDAIAFHMPPSPTLQPPTPAQSPTQPQGDISSVRPLPPVPQPQTGYCCEAGRVFRTTPAGCGGNLYDTQAAASQQCTSTTRGYCCTNGQVFPSAREECHGVFSSNQRDARASCAAPKPLSGYCCANGHVTSAAADQCHGYFFADEVAAQQRCAPSPQLGYCCAAGQLSQTNREQCRGSFFTDPASARKACTAPPEQGYCCSGGQVSQTTRDRCSGTFSRVQDEAQRSCKRQSEIDVEKGVVKRPQRDDTPR